MVTAPNIITALRFALIPFVFYFILKENFASALVLFLIASITDKLDGYLARRLNQKSSAGAAFDAFTDSVLLFSVLIALYIINSIPLVFLILLVLPRIITSIMLYFFNKRKFKVTNYSRYAGALSYIMIILILMNVKIIILIPFITAAYILTFIHWTKLAGR